jgi:hypothetical protein
VGRWPIGGQQRAEQPVVQLGVEDHHPHTLGGEHVAVAVLDPPGQPLEPQPPQVVGHLCAAVGTAEQAAHLGTQAPVGEADDGVEQDRKGAGQGHDARIPEAQGSGSLALLQRGLRGLRQQRGLNGTALADTLDGKQPAVGGASLGLELVQVGQAALAAEVGG